MAEHDLNAGLPSPRLGRGPDGRAGGAAPLTDAQAVTRDGERLFEGRAERDFQFLHHQDRQGGESWTNPGRRRGPSRSSGPGEFNRRTWAQLTGGPAIVSAVARGVMSKPYEGSRPTPLRQILNRKCVRTC